MIKCSEVIKDLRSENGFTQAMLGRAINTDPVCISNYENEKRTVTVDTMECIANVFNKTLVLTPMDKSDLKLDLCKDMTPEEIMELSEEDMIKYLLVKGNDETLTVLCNLRKQNNVFEMLNSDQIKELISETIRRCLKTDRAPLYQLLSSRSARLYDFSLIDYVCSFNEILEAAKKNMTKEVLEKVENDLVYIRVKAEFDDELRAVCNFLDIEFLDRNKNKIDLKLEEVEVAESIIPVDKEVIFFAIDSYGYNPETQLDEFMSKESEKVWSDIPPIEPDGDDFKMVLSLSFDSNRQFKDDLTFMAYLNLQDELMVNYKNYKKGLAEAAE